MRPSALVSSVALAVASVTNADIFQYEDCDGNGSLLLTTLDAEPFADLSGLYLRCASLSGADLRNANLSGSFLRNADLFGADLTGADLTNANLTNANLTNAILTNADLIGANLSGANLSGADLSGANLSGAINFIFPVSESTGSCCVSSGCTTNSESNCTELGGTWTEGGSCDDCQPAADDCPADVDGDGTIGFSDVLVILNDWGVCP